ncbi:MAG: hypothetical protein AB9888_12865 [Bacteroidales bacterium]
MGAELLLERDNSIKHLIMVEENEALIKPLEKKRVPTLEELGYSFDMGM